MMRKYPAIVPLLFLVAGILLADIWLLPSWVGLVWSFAAIVTGLVFLRLKSSFAALFFVASIGGFGATHFAAKFVDAGPRHIGHFANPEIVTRVFGTVADWPDLKPNRTEMIITVDSLVDNRRQLVKGRLLLKVSDTTTALQRGDRVEFVARLYPVPQTKRSSGFDYARYLRLKEIGAIVYLPTLLNVRVDRLSAYAPFHWVDNLRAWILTALRQSLSPRSAALAVGFLIGETRDIPPDIYRMFRDSGTMHLLAVSGSNVALVILFAMGMLRPFRLGRKARGIVLLLVVALFVLLSYGEPSVVRAAVMAALIIIARLFGRKTDLNHIISLTALIILLVSPTQLFDVGFQLSFLTAWGLIFFVPRLVAPLHQWHNRIWYKWLIFPIIISVVAQVVSTPIIAIYFHRIPVISVLANLIIVPLVSVAVLAVMVVLVAHVIFPMLGLFVGSLVNLLLELIVWVLFRLGGEQLPVISTAGLSGGIGDGWIALLVYIMLILIVFSIRHKVARRAAAMVAAILIPVGLFSAALSSDDTGDVRILLRKLPGGVVAIVSRSGSDQTDMLITGLVSQDYAIDEKILTPMVAEDGIRRIGSLFLLSADYGSARDLLRFCQRQKVDRLYLPERMRPLVEDIRRREEDIYSSFRTEYFGNVDSLTELPTSSGWLADSDYILLKEHGLSLLFVDQFGLLGELSDNLRPRGIVIGRRWSPTVTEWSHLHRSGVEVVFAAGIRPFVADSVGGLDGSAISELPEYLIDLSKEGEARIGLTTAGELWLK